jgi:hypothetical protein
LPRSGHVNLVIINENRTERLGLYKSGLDRGQQQLDCQEGDRPVSIRVWTSHTADEAGQAQLSEPVFQGGKVLLLRGALEHKVLEAKGLSALAIKVDETRGPGVAP